jgi:hypothetical protein
MRYSSANLSSLLLSFGMASTSSCDDRCFIEAWVRSGRRYSYHVVVGTVVRYHFYERPGCMIIGMSFVTTKLLL